MKVSLNWIKQYLDFELPPVDELAERIGAQLGAIEGIENLGEKYQGVLIVKVVECEKLENSDHLNRCLVDDGGRVQGVERNEQGLVQVLTGAPNVYAGMLAVWLSPGIAVPESIGAGKEPFVLESRPMRGAMSHGMLASPRELGLGDAHEGILDLSNETVTPSSLPIAPGADFAEVYSLNDHIIDIENKMFTHRPDCFGQLGVAREIAGIFGQPFTSPERYRVLTELAAGSGLNLTITNEIPEKVQRFIAVALKDVTVKPSPLWLQIDLCRVEAKPISNVVDVTNYVMLLTGQPLHAYDYDKVASGELGVRYARPGEQLALLNGKTVKLQEADMIITDGTKPIGLAGVMGGSETEVSEETKHAILECATFDMYTIRRTSMRHGLFTDAVTRFNKGQSPLQNPHVVQLAVDHMATLADSELASNVIDNDHTEDRSSVHPPVPVDASYINTRLGLELPAADMKTLLENVECTVTIDGDKLTVTAPFWRTDIELREDVVEEVGRLYGFDKLPLELPRRSIKPAPEDPLFELKSRLRAELAKAGANEVLTYSFVHGDLLRKVGQNPDDAYRVSNALSPDLQYYRLSITPSLLANVHPNVKAGYDEFALFEIGRAHVLGKVNEDGLPLEFERLALVYTARKERQAAAYYEAKRLLLQLLKQFGLAERVEFRPLDPQDSDTAAIYYEPGRAATVAVDDQVVGRIGEYKASVRKALKLPVDTAGFELGLAPLMQLKVDNNAYSPLPRFPKVTQDITLKVPTDLPFAELSTFVLEELEKIKPEHTHLSLQPLNIYQREDDAAHKQVAFRLEIASYAKTLQGTEVNHLLDTVAAAAQAQFGAERS